MTIIEKAEAYANSTLFGSPSIKKWAYAEGAKDILCELERTISVSKKGWLESNLKKLIKELKGDEQHTEEV